MGERLLGAIDNRVWVGAYNAARRTCTRHKYSIAGLILYRIPIHSSVRPSVRPVVIPRSQARLYKEMNMKKIHKLNEARREVAPPEWDQFIQCLSKAGLVSARVIHFSTQIRIWTSNRLDHSYQFVLLHRPSVIPPLTLCNLSKAANVENELLPL
ncbi:uncharacterized protein LOC118646943 [Monomorium pharaonis]|uniref:uncharacterized protein LOC118646943 n=1 Tax=Monomorium pharaonis TaxID=307658 RepID=UPI001746C155|nr:uncharacterized protein LOC118646943 [Monomorium pharaonis]